MIFRGFSGVVTLCLWPSGTVGVRFLFPIPENGRNRPFSPFFLWEVFQRPLTLTLVHKHRDTNGRRIVIQIGGVYTTFCQEEGILLQKYHDRNGRCIAILFKSIGVRSRIDSPDFCLFRPFPEGPNKHLKIQENGRKKGPLP